MKVNRTNHTDIVVKSSRFLENQNVCLVCKCRGGDNLKLDKGDNNYMHLICAIEGGFYALEETGRVVLKNNQIRTRFNLNSKSTKKEAVKPRIEAKIEVKMPEIVIDEDSLESKLLGAFNQKLLLPS